MGFLDKIKKPATNDVTKGKIDDVLLPTIPNGDKAINRGTALMINNGVDICARACSVCWDTKLPDSYEERSKYIGKRAKIGHTSVMEHSNLVIYIEVPTKEVNEFITLLDTVMYLRVKARRSRLNPEITYLILGGTWRAYADLYLQCHELYNSAIMKEITQLVYLYVPADAVRNIIDMGLLEESQFYNTNLSQISGMNNIYKNTIFPLGENIDIINCDDLDVLVNHLKVNCPEPELFTRKDLLYFVTITVNFKNMSRIITQQLTRHRNGITQESQRYVNYSKGMFNSPAKFKPDKYDPNFKYTIKFGGQNFHMNLQELGDAITGIYSQLIDKHSIYNGKHALALEDARGYLPSNVRCNTIYITFTWSSFFSFLYLREDPHAQAEIRGYALTLGKWFRDTFPKYADTELALQPSAIEHEDSIWHGTIEVISDSGNLQSTAPYEEILEEHIENYDESKEDPPQEEEAGDITLRHGEY